MPATHVFAVVVARVSVCVLDLYAIATCMVYLILSVIRSPFSFESEAAPFVVVEKHPKASLPGYSTQS